MDTVRATVSTAKGTVPDQGLLPCMHAYAFGAMHMLLKAAENQAGPPPVC